MDGISDIRIVGFDAKRPPTLRKEPYIELFFQLSHKVPGDWVEEFASMVTGVKPGIRIKPEEGLYIETWVRSPDDVAARFDLLKGKVAECNRRYIARVELATRENADANRALGHESGEQGRLNRIIAGLDFGEQDPD